MTDVTTEFIKRETLEKVVTNSNSKLTETWIDLDELYKKIFKDLQCRAWVYRWGINDSEDDTVSSDEECEEHEYGNPHNNSFPKPYLSINDKSDKNYHKENNWDTNKSDDMVLSGAPHSEELTNGQLNEKEPYGDLAETMIWYILKKTCVELIRTF
ncbi:hypothetical protein Tco_0505469 [Tanacetum coccineum]